MLEAARLVPGDASVEIDLCFVLTHAHRADEAVAHGKEAVRLDPNSALAHLNLGSALAAQERASEARAEFSEALRLNPAYNEARTALAELGKR